MNAFVVKIGGSLVAYPEKLKSLCTKLSELSKNHSLILLPGGGEFADVTRNLDEKFSLSCVCRIEWRSWEWINMVCCFQI